jgi:hypothetical protein
MRWSEAGYLSQIVLAHALRQVSVSLILDVRQSMKHKQVIIGGLVAVVVAGSVQRWLNSSKIYIDPGLVRLGRVEIHATSHATNERVPISVGSESIDTDRLFKYSISSKDGHSYELIYATDYDPLIRVKAEGYRPEFVPLSELAARSGKVALEKSQNEK